MAGTIEGGKKAAKTNRERYGDNWYSTIGKRGGSKIHPETRYFAVNRDIARAAGAKGGSISKRGKAKKDA